MNDKDLKRTIKDWAGKVGRDTALVRLINAGISSSMGLRLIDGGYDSNIKDLTKDAILGAMKKDAR